MAARRLRGLKVHSTDKRREDYGDIGLSSKAFNKAERHSILCRYDKHPTGRCRCATIFGYQYLGVYIAIGHERADSQQPHQDDITGKIDYDLSR